MLSPPSIKRSRSIWLVLILVAVFCTSCNLPEGLQERILGSQEEDQPTPIPTFTPQPLPPAIIETDPAQGSTISLGEEITIYFNQDINPDSAQAALTADPEFEAVIEWLDPATLVYKPADTLPTGSTIQIQLDTSLQAVNGLFLPEPINLVFYTPDLLKPVTFLPSPGGYEIDPSSAILVTFNQPVVPLGDLEDADSPAFMISPNVNGKGEWLNTSTYQFLPEPGLAGGTTYQVSLSSSITSLWGTGLDPEIDAGWSFSTSYPQVVSSSPYQGDAGVPLDEGIRIEFNQAMSHDSVRNFFSMIDREGRSVAGAFEWDEDNKAFTFQADDLFLRDSTYSVLLSGEAESAGGTPLALETSFSFFTAGEFKFLGTPQGQNYATSIYQGATLYFNNPVDRETVEENIFISPEVTNLYPSRGESSNVLNLYGDLEPLTTYTLTLREGLADIWGSELGGARAIQFTTEPLSPNLTISQGSSVLFLAGNENAIPAIGTNLYQVSINIGSIPEEDLDQFFGRSLYQSLEDYFPANARAWTEVVTVPGDDKYTVNLPLNEAGKALAPGVYRYQIYSQELPYNPSPYLLAVSNIHLTMKISPENLLIWALDLRTGQPVSDLDLKVYNSGGEVMFTGKTNQEGVFLDELGLAYDLYENIFYVISGESGADDFGITASNWGFGTEPYNFGMSSDYGTPRPQTYIYTDRPIYRPGQTVHYRLIHRERADGGYILPESSDLPVTIHLSGGKEENLTLSLSDYGTADGEIQLSPFADPGYYRIEAENGMVFFQVAAYRKPEIILDVSLDKAEALGGDDIQGEVAAAYYFDAPADELYLDWSLRASPTRFHLPGYQVGVLGSTWFEYSGLYGPNIWGTRIASGDGVTNQAGEWEVSQKLELMNIYDREVDLPAVYTLEITAQDETGFQISDRTDVFVHPSEFYIGVQPSAWMTVAEESVEFDIQVVDWEKTPAGVKELTAEFSKVTWNHTIGEIGEIEYTREKDLVAALEIRTTNRGEGSVSFTPPEPGTYQLDIFGGGARTEVTLWVGGPGATVWPTQTNQKIKLIPDKAQYQPGDTATIFIPNPFPEGAAALVTLERHKVISHQVLSIVESGSMFEIQLTDEDAPNVYLSVTLIGEDPEEGISFRQGYLNLLVDPEQQLLNVDIVGEPERLGPGDEVQFTIRVTDRDGRPAVGEFSLAVVDQAVLALADSNSAVIEDAFYGIQPIAVRMGLPLGVHAGRLVWVPGGMGGGGGDADISVRDRFEDTGYWQADIVTDQNGEATIRFVLPDNLTTWQADARGITAKSEVGEGTTAVITTKDLLIRPVVPRFLVAGDHLALGAVVHNNTSEDLRGSISIQATGFRLDNPDSSSQEIDIPASGRTFIEWWGTVEEIDEIDLLISANAGAYQDAVKPELGTLPVLRYTAPVSYGTSGILADPGQELEIVTLPRTFDPEAGSLELELSPSLSAAIIKALDAQEEEKRLSTVASMYHFLPNVITFKSIQDLGITYPNMESRLEILIPETLGNLEAAQNDDGGWGWWAESASDPEITAYILFGLVKVQETGILVEDDMVQRAKGYLLATLPSLDMLSESWQLNMLALRYFALAESGVDVNTGAGALAARSSQLDPAGQAFLAMALEKGSPGNEDARNLLSNLAGSAVRSATGTHWESGDRVRSWMNNSITSTAIATYALTGSAEYNSLLPEAVRYLISSRSTDGNWRSSYETGWAILVLNHILKESGELESSFDFSAAVNGTDLISGRAEGTSQIESAKASLPVENLYQDESNSLVITHGEGKGNLYYKAHLLLNRPAEDIGPFGHGLSIARTYIRAEDDVVTYTQQGNKGDLVRVQISLVVENDAYHVQVEDYIPAGAEILDSRLLTSRQDLEDLPAADPFQGGWGWWYFNTPKILDDRVIWGANYLPAGTYQLSYTISLVHPGEYQVLPARVWQVYFPETQANSAGEKFVILASD